MTQEEEAGHDRNWKKFADGFYRAVLNGVVWYAVSDPLQEDASLHRGAWVLIKALRLVGVVYDTLDAAKRDALFFTCEEEERWRRLGIYDEGADNGAVHADNQDRGEQDRGRDPVFARLNRTG